MAEERELEILIIGAGFGGLAAAIELQSHGLRNITILERDSGVGGTWLQNSYPGAACDVPSHMYSYSFAQRRDWSRLCSPQDEILEYAQGVARDHGVDRLVEPHVDVTACAWDDETRRWTVSAADGRTWESDAVIIATGQLHHPAFPRIEGLDTFAGHSFHSARWDHDYDLRGKRVAVVGTGASAVQFVPEIAKEAGKLTIFQRTGNWFMPRRNRAYPAVLLSLFKHGPRPAGGAPALHRQDLLESVTMMIRHPRTLGLIGRARSSAFMRWQLKDPELRRKVWPDYTFGCKRVLFSSHFLPALQRPNVELVAEAITAVDETGLTSADGAHHEVDCIIWGTGFQTMRFMFPMEVTGAHGQSLRESGRTARMRTWASPSPGFPSMFLMYGPNTNTSGGSIIAFEEAQAGVHPPGAPAGPRPRRRGDRRAARGRGRERPRRAGALRRDGVAALRLLVPRRARADRHELARLHARVHRAGPHAGPRRLHAAAAARPRGDRGVATGGQSLIAWSPADHRYWTA